MSFVLILEFNPQEPYDKGLVSSFELVGVLMSLCCSFADGQVSVVQALLAELPSQFLTYMRIRNMKPVPL